MNEPVVPRNPSTQRPSLGRIVHYTRDTGVTQSAIITAVIEGDRVALHVFGVAGEPGLPTEDLKSVFSSMEPDAGCWSWPPKVV
jgi:hypothetical protein